MFGVLVEELLKMGGIARPIRLRASFEPIVGRENWCDGDCDGGRQAAALF